MNPCPVPGLRNKSAGKKNLQKAQPSRILAVQLHLGRPACGDCAALGKGFKRQPGRSGGTYGKAESLRARTPGLLFYYHPCGSCGFGHSSCRRHLRYWPIARVFGAQLNSISTSQAFSGVITDSRCCARHLQDSGKSPAECVRSCVRHGAKYVLVDGDANYVLAGNPGVFAGLAGQRARILGTLDGDVLTVTAATAQ